MPIVRGEMKQDPAMIGGKQVHTLACGALKRPDDPNHLICHLTVGVVEPLAAAMKLAVAPEVTVLLHGQRRRGRGDGPSGIREDRPIPFAVIQRRCREGIRGRDRPRNVRPVGPVGAKLPLYRGGG